MSPNYFLIEDHEVTGPHSMAVLRQKADDAKISPATPARPTEPVDAIWMLIQEMPELRAELFKSNSAPAWRTTSPFKTFSASPFKALSATPFKGLTRSPFKRSDPEQIELAPPPPTAPRIGDLEAAHPPVRVEQMLKQNAYHQGVREDFDPYKIPPGPRSRRNRRFLIITLLLNVPALLAYCCLPSEIPGVVIAPTLTAGLTVLIYWMMYHLSDPFR
jgi:hypothetical protein